MAVHTILKYPSAKLRTPAKKVIDFEKVKVVAADLADTMKVNFGIGLAATQIGVSESVVVIKDSIVPSLLVSEKIPGVCVLVNPTFKPNTKKMFTWPEACLSVQDYIGNVSRYEVIDLNYQNLAGDDVFISVSGKEAGTIQHEIDHLSGVLFIDKIPSLERKRLIRRLRRKQKDSRKEDTEAKQKHLQLMKRHAQKKKRKTKRVSKQYGRNKNK